MKKQIINSLEKLEGELIEDIKRSPGPIAIIGGHYAYTSFNEAATQPCSSDGFGIFSIYTFELALKLINFGKKLKKKIKIALIVDDHSKMKDPLWYTKEKYSKISKGVKEYFKNFSIPKNFQKLMDKYNLNESNFAKSKKGLPFQESFYRKILIKETGKDLGCAGEYRLILEELANKGFKTIISLIPLKCLGPTCTSIDFYFQNKNNPEIKIIHAYLSSEESSETVDLMLEDTKKKLGGIQLIRR